MGATAKLTKVENIDNNAPALVVYCDVSIPGIGTAAGDKMLLPLSPLAGSGQYPFRHVARKYPVYIPYPFRQFDDIVITLPDGLDRRGPAGAAKERQRFLRLLDRLRRGGPEQAPHPARLRHQEELLSRRPVRGPQSVLRQGPRDRRGAGRPHGGQEIARLTSPGFLRIIVKDGTGGVTIMRSPSPRTLAVIAVAAVLAAGVSPLGATDIFRAQMLTGKAPVEPPLIKIQIEVTSWTTPEEVRELQRTLNEAGVDAFMAAFSRADKGVVRFMYARGFNLTIHAAFTVPTEKGKKILLFFNRQQWDSELPEVDVPPPVHGHRAQAQREEQGRRPILRGRPDPAGARRRARSPSRPTTASPKIFPQVQEVVKKARKRRRSSVEVAAPPVVDDEGGQVLDHDPADRFHPQVGEIDRLARDDVLLGDERRRPADRPQEDAAPGSSAPRPPRAVRLPLPSETSEAPALRKSAM